MTADLEVAVRTAIAKQKRLEASDISNESSLEQLGISSLDAITIVYEIEELFDIEVPNEELETLGTVQDIILRVESLIQARG